MTPTEVGNIVYRILSGVVMCSVGGVTYYIRPPNIMSLYHSTEIYKNVLYEESFENSSIDIRTVNRLINNPNIDKEIEILRQRQDDVKVDMYNSYTDSTSIARLRNLLNMITDKLNTLYCDKHRYDHMTPGGIASSACSHFILSETIYCEDDTRLITGNYEDAEYTLIDKIMGAYLDSQLDAKKMREVARSDTWRSYWNINKENIFGKPALELTDEQRGLIGYSKLYDNVHESSDCPPQEIIDDDDMLDGWLIKKRRERERESNERALESKLAKHSNDTEVFLPASSKEDIKKIEALNTATAQMQRKQRDRIIQQRGQVSELEFPDVQIDILNKQSEGR